MWCNKWQIFWIKLSSDKIYAFSKLRSHFGFTGKPCGYWGWESQIFILALLVPKNESLREWVTVSLCLSFPPPFLSPLACASLSFSLKETFCVTPFIFFKWNCPHKLTEHLLRTYRLSNVVIILPSLQNVYKSHVKYYCIKITTRKVLNLKIPQEIIDVYEEKLGLWQTWGFWIEKLEWFFKALGVGVWLRGRTICLTVKDLCLIQALNNDLLKPSKKAGNTRRALKTSWKQCLKLWRQRSIYPCIFTFILKFLLFWNFHVDYLLPRWCLICKVQNHMWEWERKDYLIPQGPPSAKTKTLRHGSWSLSSTIFCARLQQLHWLSFDFDSTTVAGSPNSSCILSVGPMYQKYDSFCSPSKLSLYWGHSPQSSMKKLNMINLHHTAVLEACLFCLGHMWLIKSV